MENWIQRIKLKLKQHFCEHSRISIFYQHLNDGGVSSISTCDACRKSVPHPHPQQQDAIIYRMLQDEKKQPYFEKIGWF